MPKWVHYFAAKQTDSLPASEADGRSISATDGNGLVGSSDSHYSAGYSHNVWAMCEVTAAVLLGTVTMFGQCVKRQPQFY